MSKPDDKPPGSPSRDFRADPAPTTKKAAPPQKKTQKKPHLVEPVDGSKPGSKVSAADYSRTTTGSAASTAVIPAVKDGPKNDRPSAKSARPQDEQPAGLPPSTSARRASLRLVHIEPWSVTRLAFVVSIAMMIVSVVAVSAFWVVLNMTGVWGQLNDSVTNVLSDDGGNFDIRDYLGFGRLVGLALVLSAINVVLMTALATIGAHLYNLAAQLLGGLEVTFSDH